jgi:hypothetical protein
VGEERGGGRGARWGGWERGEVGLDNEMGW